MRSRWIFLLLAVSTAAVCVRLAFWQLARLRSRRAANAIALAAQAGPPIDLPGPQSPRAGGRVSAIGWFDLEHQFVLRGRAHDGAPGVEIATPLRIPGCDTALMVIRGFVPSDDAMSVDLDAIQEAGTRLVHGIAFPISEDPDSGGAVTRQGSTTWRRLDRSALRARLPYPVFPVALWQEKDSGMSGFPIRVGAPALTDGPHLNYAIQWFAFALIFGVGGAAYSMRMVPRT